MADTMTNIYNRASEFVKLTDRLSQQLKVPREEALKALNLAVNSLHHEQQQQSPVVVDPTKPNDKPKPS